MDLFAFISVLASLFFCLSVFLTILLLLQIRKNTASKKDLLLIYAMLNMVSDCVFLLNHRGKILRVNQSVESTYGAPAQKIIGCHILRFFPDFSYEKHRTEIESAFRKNKSFRTSVTFYPHNGKPVPFIIEMYRYALRSDRCYYGVIAKNIELQTENAREISDQLDKLNEIQHLARLGYWEFDQKMKKVTWSDELYRLLGYEPGSITPNLDMLFSMADDADRDQINSAFVDAFQKQRPADLQYSLVTAQKNTIDVLMRIRHTFSEKNERLSTLGIIQDISLEKELRENLKYQMLYLKAIMNQSDLLIITTDTHDKILHVNSFTEKLTGRTSDSLAGLPASEIFGQIGQRYKDRLNQMRGYDGPLDMKDKKQHTRSILWRTQELSTPSITIRLNIGLDVTEGVQYRKKFEYLAYHDPVTGLPNRLRMRDVLLRYIDKNLSDSGKSARLLFIGLNNYQKISDYFGYQIAEAVTASLCQKLYQLLKGFGMLARFNDDILILFIPDKIRSETALKSICHQIIDLAHVPIRKNNIDLILDAKIGAAAYPDDTRSKDELERFAHAALTYARTDPSMHYYLFDDALRERILTDFDCFKNF